MGMRFKILAALYLVFVLIAWDGNMRVLGGVLDVFVGLLALLILSILALWPNGSRTDRVDRAVEGRSWADRVDIEAIAREGEIRRDR
ncbi:MAG: hypothetical protein NW216_07725 [Hyphomicrobium sp.]|nr:hypothetical protein [Hyphomicrobium sp.]